MTVIKGRYGQYTRYVIPSHIVSSIKEYGISIDTIKYRASVGDFVSGTVVTSQFYLWFGDNSTKYYTVVSRDGDELDEKLKQIRRRITEQNSQWRSASWMLRGNTSWTRWYPLEHNIWTP